MGNLQGSRAPSTEGEHFFSAVHAGQATVHFVTGRLAEFALRNTLAGIQAETGLKYTVQVLPITVAALMTPEWIAARIECPPGTTHVVLPGYCGERLDPVRHRCGLPVIGGPHDLRDLPEWLTGRRTLPPLDAYDIEIIAEINHANRLPQDELVQRAKALAADGANLIDLGCTPGESWKEIGVAVRRLKDVGLRVSVDSFDAGEVAAAVKVGVELVLSVNSSNRRVAPEWGCEVVAVPDQPSDWKSLVDTVAYLQDYGVPFRIDPILEPIGLGFAASLQRYWATRQAWPEEKILMGIGNLTELTDVDSAGVNMLLIGFCQELGIKSVLTTQVINWARTSVVECDWARRIAYYAVQNNTPAKRISDRLLLLRDARLVAFGEAELTALARELRDHHLRIFAQGGLVNVLAEGQHWRGEDPFAVFDALQGALARPLDSGHAFYLGYELAKAELALQLGKQYVQDESLNWGFLTRQEPERHRLSKRRKPDS